MTDETPIPYNDEHRLAALRSYGVLDTEPEAEFDSLTRLVARHFGVATVLISLVDEGRQWFKSRFGLDAEELPREVAFCAHAILDVRPLVVRDATRDARFARNPLVVGEPYIRFYAGVPLITPGGFKLGTLCLIDRAPRSEFSAAQVADLTAFADIVMDRLDARRRRLVENDTGAELAIAADALEDVVAHLAHEIVTPLSVIVGNAELIERRSRGAADGDEQRESHRLDATQIGDMGRYLCDLAQRTLDVASLRSGEVELSEGWLSLDDVETALRDVLMPCATAFDVRVDLALSGVPFRLHADRLRLQQMLLNLLGNAVKYTPRDGRVELRADVNADGAMDLTVTDNGPGMTFAETRRALLPFGRVHRPAGADVKGFGLGLPLTRRLVELHGGRLLIDSVKGQGTVATLRFPSYRVRRDEAPAAETARADAAQHMSV